QVGGGAGVGHDGDGETAFGRAADGRVHAHARHHADDDEVGDARSGEGLLESGRQERVRLVLGDDEFTVDRGDGGVDLGARGPRHQERGAVDAVVLDVDDEVAGGADGGQHVAGGIGGLLGADERVRTAGEVVALDVDDEQGTGHGSSPRCAGL